MEWYYLILISSVCAGAASVVEKNSLKSEHATAFSASVTPLIALLSLVFIPLVPLADFNLTIWQLLLLFITSALNAYTFLLSMRVFRHGEISTASPPLSSLPTALVVILAFLFLGERLEAFQYIGVAGIVVATYMLLFRTSKRKKGKQAFDGEKYKQMILINVCITAAVNILTKYLLDGVNPYVFLIISGMFMSICFAIFISIRYRGVKEIIETVKRYRMTLGINALLSLASRATYYLALVLAPVSLAQPLLNTVYIMITIILGGFIFHEEGLKRKIMFGAIMLFFVYLLTL
jgi:drug/metabolite transporter (DMT)-like permease